MATQLHNSSSKTHSLACSRWCVSYRVVCNPKRSSKKTILSQKAKPSSSRNGRVNTHITPCAPTARPLVTSRWANSRAKTPTSHVRNENTDQKVVLRLDFQDLTTSDLYARGSYSFVFSNPPLRRLFSGSYNPTNIQTWRARPHPLASSSSP